jgi:hypothetical protein
MRRTRTAACASGKDRTVKLLRVLLVVLTVVASTLLVDPAQARPRTARPQLAGYVALGDSYAAGEGLTPFEAGTEGAGQCHRSARQSYPVRLADSGRRAFDDLTSVACSGSITADLVTTRPGTTRAPQLTALGRRTETVTLTIGGNDAGFGLIFRDCVYSPDPVLATTVPGEPGCATRHDAAVSARIAALAGGPSAPTDPRVYPLPDALAQVAAAAPRTTIYVTGYPLIFGSEIDNPFGCQVSSQAPLFVTTPDAAWIRSKAVELNAAIRSAVISARRAGADVHFVNVARTFRGHHLCDTGAPWLNGVVLTSLNPPEYSVATFHPTARGQRAYARSAVAKARQQQAHR